MFAYVPARGGSKRIPRKNLRLLGGKPVLEHVLDALAAVEGLSGIGVSSEDPEVLALAERHPAARVLGPRDARLADDRTDFRTLLVEDAPRFAHAFGDEGVLFVLATAALVPTESYGEALALHRERPAGLVLAVTEYAQPPFLALAGDPSRDLEPLFRERYLEPTASLPRCYVDSGCFYALELARAQEVAMFLDLRPVRGVVLPPGVGIDVDTEADWARLEEAHARRSRRA